MVIGGEEFCRRLGIFCKEIEENARALVEHYVVAKRAESYFRPKVKICVTEPSHIIDSVKLSLLIDNDLKYTCCRVNIDTVAIEKCPDIRYTHSMLMSAIAASELLAGPSGVEMHIAEELVSDFLQGELSLRNGWSDAEKIIEVE